MMHHPTRHGADGAPLSARGLLRWQFRLAHKLLEATIDDLSTEALHRHPPGPAAPAAARYAQAVLCEDLSVNSVLAGRPPLALGDWAGRTGLSELPALVSPTAEQACWGEWARRVRLDLAAFQAYARAVYATTDAYLAGLPDAALGLAGAEMPACLLSALLLTVSTRRGEIASLLALEHSPTANSVTHQPVH
jgi:hypothetical protein